MRAPKVVDFYTAAWPDFTPALTLVWIFRPTVRASTTFSAFRARSKPPVDPVQDLPVINPKHPAQIVR